MKSKKALSTFDMISIDIMKHLMENDVVSDEVIDNIRKLQLDYYSVVEKNKILEEQINIDTKTSLLKYKDDYLGIIIKTASRFFDRLLIKPDYKISYVRFDLDDFSLINNRFGHDNGDLVLINTAKIIKKTVRPTDFAIRYGGEEFDLILPDTGLKEAIICINRIYNGITKANYLFDKQRVSVTASAGVSVFSVNGDNLKQYNKMEIKKKSRILQKGADNALYDAKLSGKNQYKIYDEKLDYLSIRKKYSRLAQISRKMI